MKRIEEPESMREIHEIREKIFEETKGMTVEERIAYTKKRTEQMEKEGGFKLKRLAKTT